MSMFEFLKDGAEFLALNILILNWLMFTKSLILSLCDFTNYPKTGLTISRNIYLDYTFNHRPKHKYLRNYELFCVWLTNNIYQFKRNSCIEIVLGSLTWSLTRQVTAQVCITDRPKGPSVMLHVYIFVSKSKLLNTVPSRYKWEELNCLFAVRCWLNSCSARLKIQPVDQMTRGCDVHE